MKIFETVKLEDLVSRVKVGFVGSINDFYCDSFEGVPLIRTTDLSGIDLDKLKFVTKEFHLKNKKSQVKKGDLIVARHGDNGSAVVFDKDYSAQVLNAVIIEPDINKLSPYLLKLFLESPFVIKQIKGAVKGSVQGVINTQHIADLMLPFNEKINYAAIEQLIFSIDEKIEINNRINAELEAMAKTLYDYWFVQFDFPFDFAQGKPDTNGKPYKISGGKMVYDPIAKREIPEGWEVWNLEDLVDVVKGNVSPSDIDPNTPYVGLEHIGRKTIVLSDWSTSDSANSDKTAFSKHDILFGKIRPYFHKVAVALFDGITSTDTILLRPKKNYCLGLALETVFTEIFIEAATQSSTGSKMPRADWNVLKFYKVPVPNADLLKLYQRLFDDLLRKIELSVLENKSLSELRDWLLPMLINGQVTVKQ